jgi:hypothetical protein
MVIACECGQEHIDVPLINVVGCKKNLNYKQPRIIFNLGLKTRE